MRRLWVDGQDYGTMSEWVATMMRDYLAVIEPETDVRIDPVDDDAPVFLQ